MSNSYGFYTVKGGSGCTTVACAFALAIAAQDDTHVLIVDWGDDVAACLGAPEPADEMTATSVKDNVSIMSHRGWNLTLADNLDGNFPIVVHDFGNKPTPEMLNMADEYMLVTRSCYMGLRQAVKHDLGGCGVVVVMEPGRALSVRDIERAVTLKCVAEVVYDPAVARAIDAGLLACRSPESIRSIFKIRDRISA